ncbi:mannose-1-phosphate guanylyltransferase/mannose-6-phosphate isomerase [Cupriavidus basilensis]|uniref:mannose-1-phosphate guanylyltransferase/mannose-6-phosphate isomerase n=1 Tax=Cupriavidus basilensis TaxID=68895 RepID=UPI003D33D0B2
MHLAGASKKDTAGRPRPCLLTANIPLLPVILAGGSGTRLWPLSRERFPKQLLKLLGDESLFQITNRRLDGLSGAGYELQEPLLVCRQDHHTILAEQLHGQGRTCTSILEPVGRNTAPALTMAALHASENGQDPVMVVMPSDHLIQNVDTFHDAIREAARLAAEGTIATLGVVPDRAAAGYGYIRLGAGVGTAGARRIDRFVEKPSQTLAQTYLNSGEYWWNSGIFVMRASAWLAAIQDYRPDILEACQRVHATRSAGGESISLDADAFAACPSESVDYAVMERLGAEGGVPAVVVPLPSGWSDIGSWDALWEVLPKNEKGNVSRGNVLFENSTGNLIHSEGRLVACLGVDNVVVIETADAILVAGKAHAQDVKTLVDRMKLGGHREIVSHRKEYRPWGHFESLGQGHRHQVKRLVVEPGETLSLQMHYHRAEHWVVVSGTAEVRCGSETFLLTENQSTFIPTGTVHQVRNPGKTLLEIIEVQSGSYLGEDDIVRFEDKYGRQQEPGGAMQEPSA